MGNDMKITEVGDGLFQFKFSMESQLDWVINNEPWSFDNHILLLRRWEKGMTAFSVKFLTVPICVQVWGLPFDLINKEAGRDIDQGIGRVIDVDSKAISSDKARFLRCGLLGHEAKACIEVNGREGEESPYGEWLRARFRKPKQSPERTQPSPMRQQAMETGERSLTRANMVDEPLPTENPRNYGINGGVTVHQAPIMSHIQNQSLSMHETDVLEEENPDLMEGIKRMANLAQENNQGFNARNFVNVPIEYATNMVSN
nr:hypothetical protein CFP56_75079 [Quercus suber]